MFSSASRSWSPIFRSKGSLARLDAFKGKVSFPGPRAFSCFAPAVATFVFYQLGATSRTGPPGGQTSQIRARNAPGRHLSRRTALLKSAKNAAIFSAHPATMGRLAMGQLAMGRLAMVSRIKSQMPTIAPMSTIAPMPTDRRWGPTGS